MTDSAGSSVQGQVFISYVRENSDRVDWLCQVLEAAGIPVWLDTAQLWPGQDWRAVIRRAIREDSLAFLACFSSQSVSQSRTYQNEEIVLAINEMRLRPPDQSWLIPVRFDDCQIPDRSIGGDQMLSDLHQSDLFGDNCQRNADRLVEAIRRILSRRRNLLPAPRLDLSAAPPRWIPPRRRPAASSPAQSKYAINFGNRRRRPDRRRQRPEQQLFCQCRCGGAGQAAWSGTGSLARGRAGRCAGRSHTGSGWRTGGRGVTPGPGFGRGSLVPARVHFGQ